MKKKILVSTSSFGEVNSKALDYLSKTSFEIIKNPYGRKLTADEVKNLLDDDVVGIIAGLEELSSDTLKNSNVRVISRVGSGVSNIDEDFIKKKNIKLFITATAPVNSVAEITILNILSLLRNTHEMNYNMHNMKWERKIGKELDNKNVVIFGYGQIGRKVSSLLEAFGAKVYFVDPYISENKRPKNLIKKKEAISIADIISIHVNKEVKILNSDDFKMMKKNIYILNSSRGKCISEKDLIDAIKNKIVKGAWIDTFDKEPYSGPLVEYENIILTPHAASFTEECRVEMEYEASKNIISFLNGKLK